ncbi:hypothetical protein FDW83_14570 [Pseudarthrobacter sp. NamE2]|uniref:OB-fold protein n=1 Tax=Pseudarthrobacter sp. NamE2 TaxID=2576838 RepID=UPI0010FEA078|nr:hypothetical protein [Pseudarthrobacter sp. NamE2]TLM81951.1 hypothetical protein FDW83_14570 [Pseudarthrobacter sp. NamE2]
MTDNTMLQDAQRHGKAQAAAEKAYRKASRPWFKKKRFIIPLVFVLIMIISSIANGGKDENATSSTPAAEAPAVAPAAAAAPAAPEAPAPAAAPAQAAPEVMQVEAGQLLADFEGNEAAADAKYKGKVLQVTGFVDKVDTEFLDKDQYVVQVDNGDKYSFIHVNCNDVDAARAAAIVPESAITVRGTFQDGGDLGVELKACEVL